MANWKPSWKPTYNDFIKYPLDVLEEVQAMILRDPKELYNFGEDARISSLMNGGPHMLVHRDLLIATFAWHESLQSMLRCWQDCQRDHLRAKLTWAPGY